MDKQILENRNPLFQSSKQTRPKPRSNLLNISQEQMLQQNGLRALQVSVTRNNETLVPQSQGQQRHLKLLHAHEDPVDGVPAPEAKVGQNLIVSTPSGVELLRRLTDHVGERSLDVHVHVLSVSSPIELSILNAPLYFLQAFNNGVSVALAYQTLKKQQ